MTDAVKRYREILAYCLLGVAALYLLAGLSLLFKSEEDFGLDFSARAAAVGNVFAHPLLIGALVLAVVLVAFGEPSRQARTVVLVALGIAGVSLLLAVICWLSALGGDEVQFGGGLVFAGTIVGALAGLAQLVLLGATALFAYAVLQSLPKPAAVGAGAPWNPQTGWGQQPQGQADPAQQGWGQYDASNPGYAQQWGQPGGYAQPAPGQQGWGPAPAPQQVWGQPQPQPQQSVGQPEWGQPAQPAYDQSAYDQSAGQQTWQPAPETPAEWGHPQQQWGSTAYPPGPPAGGGWADPQPQQGWGQPAEPYPGDPQPGEQAPEQPAAADEPHTGATAADSSTDASDEQSDSAPEQDPPGGWWQRPQQ